MVIEDFKKVYTVNVIHTTGKIESTLRTFNQNVWAVEEMMLSGRDTYTHSPSERLYFMPGCTVARIKVRDLCSKQGGVIVKDPERATTIFFSEESVNQLFETSKSFKKLSRIHFLNWLKKVYLDGVSDPIQNATYEMESKKVLQSEYPFVLVNADYNNYENYVDGSSCLPWKGDAYINVGIEGYHWADAEGLLVKEDMEGKASIINSPLLCRQEALIKHLNVMEVDDAMFKEVGNMLQSDDDQNLVVGMEIMANCNYDKSLPYLIALMKIHHQKIGLSPSRDHVNFKTFLAYINIPGQKVWAQKDLREMGIILKEKGQNTKTNMELLVRLLAPEFFQDIVEEKVEEDPFLSDDDDGVIIPEEL